MRIDAPDLPLTDFSATQSMDDMSPEKTPEKASTLVPSSLVLRNPGH